ncbi:MAG: SPASM domain-containing protein [Planctomycetota bacterium]|nr:SPASM domain-containing protein [Planctomycetota bacterium]
MAEEKEPLGILVKPAGADCNLACDYCFYRGKTALYPEQKRHRMSVRTMEEMLRQWLPLAGPNPCVGWQGGEPALCGLEFFERAVDTAGRLAMPGQRVAHSIQTNGTLIDDRFAAFLAREGFLVGLSLDGPPEIHNAWRRAQGGRPSHSRTIEGYKRMRGAGAMVNALVVVTPGNVSCPDRILDYLFSLDIRHVQFIPLAERDERTGRLIEATVDAEAFGEFLCRAFDRWASGPRPDFYCRLFDEMLIYVATGAKVSCMFREACGSYVVVEHNGDIYPCDFFVCPEWKLGNILRDPLEKIVGTEKFRAFRRRKAELPARCSGCEFLDWCHGACPKYRGMDPARPDMEYFCPSYRRFFAYARARLENMAARWRRGELS